MEHNDRHKTKQNVGNKENKESYEWVVDADDV
jgi:hypothetical protein